MAPMCTSGQGGSQGTPIPFTQFFQQPSFTTISVNTTVVVPVVWAGPGVTVVERGGQGPGLRLPRL